MSKESTKSRSRGWVLAVIVILISAGLFIGVSQISTTTVVDNVKQEVQEISAPQETEEEKALKEIESRPEVQTQFENLVKEIYLSEERDKKAKELEEAEAKLEAHRTEVVSF